MKEIIIILIMLISIQSKAYYSRTTKNGGANGYKKTTKITGSGHTTIWCEGPGEESCPHIFKQSPETDNDPNIDNADFLLSFAIEKIQNGVLTGEESYNNLTVRWTSDDLNLSNSEIKVE